MVFEFCACVIVQKWKCLYCWAFSLQLAELFVIFVISHLKDLLYIHTQSMSHFVHHALCYCAALDDRIARRWTCDKGKNQTIKRKKTVPAVLTTMFLASMVVDENRTLWAVDYAVSVIETGVLNVGHFLFPKFPSCGFCSRIVITIIFSFFKGIPLCLSVSI